MPLSARGRSIRSKFGAFQRVGSLRTAEDKTIDGSGSGHTPTSRGQPLPCGCRWGGAERRLDLTFPLLGLKPFSTPAFHDFPGLRADQSSRASSEAQVARGSSKTPRRKCEYARNLIHFQMPPAASQAPTESSIVAVYTTTARSMSPWQPTSSESGSSASMEANTTTSPNEPRPSGTAVFQRELAILISWVREREGKVGSLERWLRWPSRKLQIAVSQRPINRPPHGTPRDHNQKRMRRTQDDEPTEPGESAVAVRSSSLNTFPTPSSIG
ncbi:hypothetical protein CPLU01_00089 [Colletotrichum plurivorum]|uniref:Uncharacterized protein n=1 Tax=Colletotrichum plurivorum TaxID=2175906 RepID=A0A8H6NSX0_9PEZI|nr:hypothetical protein CPLU01_00089 [Colletotrichum plurivorum]